MHLQPLSLFFSPSIAPNAKAIISTMGVNGSTALIAKDTNSLCLPIKGMDDSATQLWVEIETLLSSLHDKMTTHKTEMIDGVMFDYFTCSSFQIHDNVLFSINSGTDSTGCGDRFIAGVIYAILSGAKSWQSVLVFGSVIAKIGMHITPLTINIVMEVLNKFM